MRFTLNRLPSTSNEHPTQAELVATYPDAGVETITSHPRVASRQSQFLHAVVGYEGVWSSWVKQH